MDNLSVNKQLIAAVLLWLCISVFTFARIDYNPSVPCLYNSSGRVNTGTKIWIGRVAVTSASAQSVDISSAGFTSIISASIQPENNTATATAMPNMSVNACSTTALTFNTLVSNSGVLGILSGLIVPTSFTGFYCNIVVIGQ